MLIQCFLENINLKISKALERIFLLIEYLQNTICLCTIDGKDLINETRIETAFVVEINKRYTF